MSAPVRTFPLNIETSVEVWPWNVKNVLIRGNGHTLWVSHESNLPSWLTGPGREYAVAEIRNHRPTAEYETRSRISRHIATMRVEGGALLTVWPSGHVQRHARQDLTECYHERPERLAFFDKHAPRPHSESTCIGEITGTVKLERGCTKVLRWHEGRREFKSDYGDRWIPWTVGARGCAAGDRWFEANEASKVWGVQIMPLVREHAARAAEVDRPLADNETISTSGKRGTMSIENAPYRFDEPRLCVFWEDESMSFYARSVLSSQGGDWARRLAFFEANLPNERVVDGYKLRRISDSEVKILTPFTYEATFRREWSGLSGGAIFRLVNLDTLSESVIRACCDLLNVKRELPLADHVLPANQYRLPNGEVLTFRMRDDGHAEAREADGGLFGLTTEYPPQLWHAPFFHALHAWRDAEVAKWTFDQEDVGVRITLATGKTGGSISVFYSGDWRGSPGLPTYIRLKAEQMWKERAKKPAPVVYKGTARRGSFGGNGPPPTHEWPAHILEEARAKFRANYVIKPNELWLQGLPVEMRFCSGGDSVKVDTFGFCWLEDYRRESFGRSVPFASDTERLEAFDRMRAYYYEQHPSKGLDPDGYPVEFVMIGDVGAAAHADGGEPIRSDTTLTGMSARWQPLQDKLRKWTDEQLAKRKTVVFETQARVFMTNCGRTIEVHQCDLPDGGIENGQRVRVTIEAVEG